MAKFFVGQRVRVIRATYYPQFIGAESVVREIDGYVRSRNSDKPVRGLVTLNIRSPDPKYAFLAYPPEDIEPIIPEGAAPSIYSYQKLMDKLREGERV